ncbi:acid-sensing ion channel 4-A [Hemiscyllium ocellatum]|uniref:acid-sensing ion channel 4-A n=1 Tax=Hemiscyllium ocellatum TaxID=170820 RepID=UPI0029677AE9|nr:acid-sensing ion channel 4-A [Hemiscyllium ocellatum]
MPIEIVCKIAFSEDDEKHKGAVECDKRSLIEEGCQSSTTDLVTFADTCSLHGINHIFVPGGCGLKQSLWAVAFISSVMLFLYQVVNCTVYYLKHHHVTALDEESHQEIPFPAITICNMNRFRHTALTDADIYHLANMTGLPPKSKDAHKAVTQGYPVADMMDIFNRTGHQIEEMLKNCNFSGSYCSAHNFSVVYTRYGKCYTFNANKTNVRKMKQGGMGNGLEIMLDIQQDEYLPIWQETDETSFEAGIRVQIHSPSEPPYIHQLGFGVPPGFQTFVSCQEQRLTYLPPPWGECRSDLTADLPGYQDYSLTACRIQCEKEAVLRECHCRMVHMPGTEAVCNPEQYMECADRILDGLIINSNQSCKCETPCHLTRYNKELSMVKMPSKGSSKYLAKKFNTTERNIKDNYLVLDVYFEVLNFETIEQKKAYDVAGLLGDIGGHMGLFIGASLLTILEIIDYIFELIRVKVRQVLTPHRHTPTKTQDSIATLITDNSKLSSSDPLRCPPEGMAIATNPASDRPQHRLPYQDFAC